MAEEKPIELKSYPEDPESMGRFLKQFAYSTASPKPNDSDGIAMQQGQHLRASTKGTVQGAKVS
jgi:hypothetical protein